MIDVEIKTVEPEVVAFVAMRGPYNQVPDAMGRLYRWVASQGLAPAGMPRAVYLTAPGETPESEAAWEVMTPVSGDPPESAADEDGCGVRHVGAQLVACTTYIGPYELIAPTYRELGAWVTANGYAFAGPPSELYLSDPATTLPEAYLTEIRFPVARP